MRQYLAMKQQFPSCILFMRVGDFYELFFDDAVLMSRALGLTLTERPAGVPMAGVPHHQLNTYLKRAVDQGLRIAVADQIEDPAEAKGLVERAVTSVITPGTLVDESLVRDDRTAHLAAVAYVDDLTIATAIVDLSTGVFRVLDSRAMGARTMIDSLARFGIGELLYAETADGRLPPRIAELADPLGAAPTPRPAWHFRLDEAMQAIRQHYDVAGVEGFGLTSHDPTIPAIGVILRYLEETQSLGRSPSDARSGSEFQNQSRSLLHLRPPQRETNDRICCIDAASLRSLEIERTIRSELVEGSLLGIFLRPAHTKRSLFRTPMGKRLIRDWLCAPSRDLDEIHARQRCVAVCATDTNTANDLSSALANVQDIARIAGRVALGRATPRDLVALARSVLCIEPVIEAIRLTPAFRSQFDALNALLDTIAPVAAEIACTCVETPPHHLRDGGLIRDGIDAALDEARTLARDASAWLADYQARLIAEHDLPSLKVGFNRVFGYYIELPSAQARRAPDAFSRKQTLKNAERYITPELREFEQKVTTAEARALERERALFASLCTQAMTIVAPLGQYADIIAYLDTVLALGEKARLLNWICPEVVAEPGIDIRDGRHPVLAETLETRFVPNDLTLATDGEAPLALITGPNMAGKSTFIRQTALLVLLAQVGSFIPASKARIGIVDRIFTRVGADDALHRGQSTFMVEMIETANILNNATPQSLVILDEIGRGTSTLDGLSLAWAITEHLAALGPLTLFATHYHELTDLEERMGGKVRNLHVAVREWETTPGRPEIVFLHEIRPGQADQSYGVHVARLAGVPAPVTDRAREILDSLAVQHNAAPVASSRKKSDQRAQLPLFALSEPHPVVEELREVKIELLTPLAAFDLLRDMALRAKS